MQEFETCKRIKTALLECGIEPERDFSEPAVVAVLRGTAGSGPTIALRADMDALPIVEKSKASYTSQNPGIMHACGHDAHMAMVIGAGIMLNEHLYQMCGNVKLIFQPSEEVYPGGAYSLIEQGVLENPHVDAILAHHVQSHIEVGRIGIKTGNFMAATKEFTLSVKGKSGHAAHPQRGIDSIVVAAQIILALQTIVSRLTTPTTPIVLSVCTISGGTKSNVLAGEVTMCGTVRTLDDSLGEQVRAQMEQIVRGITQSCGASYSLKFDGGYPAVRNDSSLAMLVKQSAAKILGQKTVFEIQEPSMGGEDFAWYQHHRPGVITNLGCGNTVKGIVAPIHNEHFDIDEDCIAYGAAVMAQVAWDYIDP